VLQYIKSILPRLSQLSKTLDSKENFVDKRWVMLDTDNNTHEYFFKRDGKLLLFINGEGKQGIWELLDGGKRLMVEVGNEIKLLQSAFIQDGLFVLKKSAGDELAFALYNPDVVVHGDIEKYIENLLGHDSTKNTISQKGSRIYETNRGPIRIKFQGDVQMPRIGDSAEYANTSFPADDVDFTISDDNNYKLFRVESGRLTYIRRNTNIDEAYLWIVTIFVVILILAVAIARA
jgi:hypothetical protein